MNCNVCNQNVDKIWNSYGGDNICQSCRVFFYRSVQSSAYKTFEKQKCETECVIESKNRKSCKICRFQKCVSVGMKVSYVKTNEIQEVEKPFGMEFTLDMRKEMLIFWHKVWNEPVSNSTFRTFASSERHLLCHFISPNWGLSENEDSVEFYQHIDIQEMKSYALTYFQMENLKSHDAITLFKYNYQKMSTFWAVLFMCSVSITKKGLY